MTQQDAELAKALDAKFKNGQAPASIKILGVQVDPASTGLYGVVASDGSKLSKDMPGVLGSMTIGVEGKTPVSVPAICQRFMDGDAPSFKYIPAQRAPAVVETLGRFDRFYKATP